MGTTVENHLEKTKFATKLDDNNLISEFKRVLDWEAEALQKASERLSDSKAPFQSAVVATLHAMSRSLDQGGKVVITGVGKSGKIGQKIAATLCSTGCLSVFLHPTEGLHGDLGLVQEKDVLIALSYTGNSEEMVSMVPWVKKRGVTVVGMGGRSRSRLAQLSDIWIDASVEKEACPHNLAPTSSTTLCLALGDALAVGLMALRGFKEEQFARNHPGGALGRRLSLQVKDLMIPQQDVAVLSLDSLFEEVIAEATSKPWGAVLVLDQGRLKGIITDGDIRRSLKAREEIFSRKAFEIMTTQPVTVTSESLVAEALDVMENRQSQIHVLPVLDSNQHCVGLLRLHDVVRAL